MREVLRQRRLPCCGDETATGLSSPHPWRQGALEWPCKTSPGRKVVPGLGHNCDLPSVVSKCARKDALAFSLAIDIRCIEKTDAALKGSVNEARGVRRVNPKNRAEPVATKSESFLRNVGR